jgi:hypothetical protein
MPSKSKSIKITHERMNVEVELAQACTVVETEETFNIYIKGMSVELNVIQAMTLRNKLSAWANAKRYRDQRNGNNNNANESSQT